MTSKPRLPGHFLQKHYLEPLGLSLTQAAKQLGIVPSTLSFFLKGKRRLTPEIAARLALVFKTADTFWIDLQAEYDRWLTKQYRKRLLLKPFSTTKIRKPVKSSDER